MKTAREQFAAYLNRRYGDRTTPKERELNNFRKLRFRSLQADD